ncbi:13369_t:CDS:10 [Funneliformis mosseae]|uniref:13369_t:CDS:1 n=1 Tax=Funneliformis mosseae TaxID=27381 RepID=A0A9N9AT65_FUNMO|nr:13369_t:CDS:10 [Funneliformis mosseae]
MNAGGSDLFESYEQDFSQVARSIEVIINSTIPSQSGEKRKTTIRAAEREIEEADEIIAQMEMELLNLPQSSRSRCQAKMRSYKSSLDKLKRDLKRASSRASGPTDREELLAGTNGTDLDSASLDQRARLLSGTELLADSSRRLQDSHRIALETETIGANVLEDIRRQRDQILHTRNTLMEADSYIDKAQRTLKEEGSGSSEQEYTRQDSEEEEEEESITQNNQESDDSDSVSSEEEGEDGEEVALDDLSDQEIDEDIIPQQHVTINNKSALKKIQQEIKLDLPWIETQVITSSEPIVIKDINNDQALEAATEGRKKVVESGVMFSRPDDYFAEMVKSDEHMTKVRQKLINEEQMIKVSEDAKRQRELKKFSKKVQIERLQERQKQKREDLEKIKAMKKKRKGVEDTAVDDDFEIALEEAAAEDDRPPNKKQKTSKKSKRTYKDSKFGFGGKKRHAKTNTAESSGDLTVFGGGGKPMKKSSFKPKKNVTKTRPGKARRQASRNKKR